MTRPATRPLGELARELGLPLEGDPSIEIHGLAGLDDAREGELSFVTGPRYARAFQRSKGSAFLAPPEFSNEGRPVLRSPAPYADFARAIALFEPSSEPPPGVHPTAVLGEGVELGRDVSIGPYAVIGAGARIGDRTRIHPHVTVYPGVRIAADCEIHSGAHLREAVELGNRVVVHSGAVLGSQGFGFTFTAEGRRIRVPHSCGVHVGDDVEIGANTTIDASHAGQGRHGREHQATWVAPGVKIDNQVQVGHGCAIGENATICAQVGLAGSTEVGRNVMFGGQAAAGGHLEIGDGALIGGRCGVVSSVDPGAQVHGFPQMDRRLWARVAACWKRLPELVKRVRRIEDHLGLAAE